MISVIVPVYKVEQYLNKCVESIVNQTFRDLEIILMDDGSPDNCPAMCDEWAAKDSRIRVIHKENGGAGKARNAALAETKGDWITFVDSDDFLTDMFAYEYMMSLVTEDVDVVESGFIIVDSEPKDDFVIDPQSPSEKTYSTSEALALHIQDVCFKQIIWNKIYRREIVKGVTFPEGKLIDDEFWTYQVIGKARMLVASSKVIYAYRQQEGSVMHQSFSLRRLQAMEAKAARYEYIVKNFPQLENMASVNYWNTAMYQMQMSLKYLETADKDKAIKLIRSFVENVALCKDAIKTQPLKQRIWLRAAKCSLVGTCRLRNLLKIGI